MAVNIHSSAIVDPTAELGENVVVEAFAMVGKMRGGPAKAAIFSSCYSGRQGNSRNFQYGLSICLDWGPNS